MIREGNLGTSLVSFVGALCVLAVLFLLAGIDETLSALSSANPAIVLVVVVVAICWLTAWGLSLRTVLGVLDASITVPTALLVYTAATFANNVTPLGHAGGEPVSALFISKASETEYENGLAAIASVDALNFVPSIGLAIVGFAYFATTITLGQRLEYAAVAVGGFALALPIVAYFGWHNRYRVERKTVDILTPFIQWLGKWVPRQSPPEQDAVERRIEGFFTAVERVATNPRGLILALAFSALGWIGLATSLWLSLFSLGYTVSLAVVLVAIPAAAMAGITPLPGGLGAVELVLGALIVAVTGIPEGAVAAAIAIHRSATYLLPTITGGGIAAVLTSS